MGRKMGAGSLTAFLKHGFTEIRGSMFTESNVAQQHEATLYGAAPRGEIADTRGEKPKPVKAEEKKDSPLQESQALAQTQTPEPTVPEIGLEK